MKNKLLFRKAVTQLFLSLCLMLCCANSSWGQQVIGSYPIMDGGFEGQTVGALPITATAPAVNTTWAYGTSGTAAISNTGSGTTGPRTGSKYAVVSVNSTSIGRQLISPAATATITSGGSYVVQYYTRNATASMFSIPVGVGTVGGNYAGDGKNTTTTWNKVTQVVTSSATDLTTSVAAFRTKLSAVGTGGFDVDDVVIYAGAVDGTAPVAATGGAVTGLAVSWTASSDVDGGGYMVVRYATNPNADNDPNANGIYAVGNTITSGVVPLTGTVVYLGTGTSFTDAVAGSTSGSDYYKVYTVDKAFNYATEITATAVVSSTPTITSSSELLTGFNYTGMGPSASQSFLVSGSNLTNNLVVSTASTDFELSSDNFATAGASSISLSGTTVASTTLYVRLKASLTGGLKTATVTIASTGANTLPTLSLSGSVQAVYYYNGSGLVSSNTSWGENSDGTGANPADVTAAYTNFVIANGNATTAASWTLGSNSKVIVGNGSAVSLTVADTFPITGTIDATASGSVVWKHLLSSPTFGTLDNASEVHFQPAAAASYSFGASTAYGNLFIDGVGVVSVSNTASTPTVKTALTVASGSTLSFTSNANPTISINATATATINGKVITFKATGLFVAGGSIPLIGAATLVLGPTSTIEFGRPTTAQSVTGLPVGVNYANLILSDGGSSAASAKTIATPFTVNGTLTINLATPAFSTISAASNITMANGATVVMTSGVLGAIPSFAVGSKFNVTYNGTGKTQIIGATTLSSTSVTLASSNAAIVAGMTVTGTPIPAGTTVASISGTALVLSAAATTTSATPTLTFGTVEPQTTGVDLPTVANDALGNLTIDNPAGIVLSSAVKANTIITSKSNALTLNTADFLDANVQMNAGSELTLIVNANQANLKQILFSGATGTTNATTAKLKLNMSTDTQVAFANSSAQNWGTGTIEITGFQEGKIKFGSSNIALTATQLGLIKDTADLTKTFKLSDQGYLYYSTTIIPGDSFVVTSDNPVYLASGVASTYVITTTAPNTPTSFALGATALPAGLTLNATSGAITGTPSVTVTNLSVPITLSNGTNSQIINFVFNVKTRTAQAITWNDNLSGTHTYGDPAIALTATTDAPLSVSYSSSNTAVATISGSTLTIVAPGTTTITAIQAGDPDYSPATNLTKELVVNAKALSIAGAAATSKIYNQSTTAAITGTLAGGLVGADVVTLVLSGTFADANVGTDISVTSTSTLTGADAAKYSLTQPTGLIATISKKDQTLAGIGGQSVHILGDADYYPYALVTDANATGLPSVDIENPNYTYSSDNSSVATVVTDGNGKQKIHIVGLGTAVITASLSGTSNFNESPLVPHTLTVLPVPLASWDLYNFNVTSTSPQATSTSATQSVSGIATPTIGIGNHTTGTPPSGTALYPFGSRYRFNSSDWPYAATADPIAPIDIATGKYMSVVIQSNPGKRMSLSNINASFRGAGSVTNEMLSQFAYSTDGTTFTAIGSATSFNIIGGIKYYSSIDLSGISALQNLPAGTTVTLRYYASGKYGTGAPTTNNGRQWGFSSEFSQGNTRALIIGGSVVTAAPTVSAQSLLKKASTVAALPTTGTAGATLKWYDAATGGDALVSSAALTTNTYYVSQTLDGQESSRTAVAVTVNSEIPANGSSALTFCKGATIATAIGSTSLKFYAAVSGTAAALTSTTALATKTLYVTEMTNGQESSTRVPRAIVVNNLPATPSALTSTESALICKYINSSTPVTFTATAASAVSYIWTVPAGAVIDSGANSSTGAGTSSSIGVNFAGASTTVGAIGAVTVKSVDANGCVSLVKSLTLTTKLPTAPTALTMTSGDTTPSFKGIITPAVVDPPTPAVYGLVGLNTLTAGIKKVGPYMGTETVFTMTAPAAVTAASYLWTLPTGVNAIASSTVAISSSGVVTSSTPVITANFAGVTSGTTALPIVVQSVGGCGNSTNKTLSLARVIPTAPTALVLTNTSQPNLSSLAKITKVGPYTGTEIAFTLTATPFTTQGAEATSYAWVLPTGVVCTTCSPTTDTTVSVATTAPDPITSLPVTTTTTLAAFSSASSTITVNFSGAATKTTGDLLLSVYAVNGSGNSVAKTLKLARVLPTAPTKLELKDGATVVTKVGPYTAKETPLTLTATPFTTQGAEATSFNWVLPAGVNVTAGHTNLTTPETDINGNKTWTSTGAVLTINLAGISGSSPSMTSIPLNVYAVNGAGTSAAAKTLTVTALAPATPAITGATTYNSCNNVTYTAALIQGATYNWVVPAGATFSQPTVNSISVDYSTVTVIVGASAAVTCSATNGTGTSGIKSLTVKRTACPAKLSNPSNEFSVVAYPNPSTEGFRVKSGNGKSFGVQVYDMLGRSIEQRQLKSDAPIGSNYAKGIYNVIVTQDANVKTLRVIKQ